MQPSHKSGGSFINREALSKQMEEAKASVVPAQPAGQVPAQPAVKPAEVVKDSEPPTESHRDQEALLKMVKAYEDATGVVITEEHIQDYIFRGALKVSDVKVIPGHMLGVFQTLTPTQELAIDARMAKVRDGNKFTQEGVDTEKALILLSYCWLAAYKVGGEVKSLGANPEDREKTLRQMGSHVVQFGGEAWNALTFLIRYNMRKEALLKKS